MVFVPPAWAPALPDLPDSISVEQFVHDKAHGRRPLAASPSPYTCGLSGRRRAAPTCSRAPSRAASACGPAATMTAPARSPRPGTASSPSTRSTRRVGPPPPTPGGPPLLTAGPRAARRPPQIDYVPLTLAVHRFGGIVAPVGAACSPRELEHQLRVARARALFTCRPLLAAARAAARAAAVPDDRVFLLPLPGDVDDADVITVDHLVAEGAALVPLEPLRWPRGQGARQPAYLAFSSGTSGMPKAVIISHLNVVANVTQLCLHDSVARRQLGIRSQRSLGALPFSHLYGLVLISLVAQYRGDEVVVLPRFDLAAALARHVEEHKARYKWLRGGVEFVDAVPKSPTGKILRRLLRDAEAKAAKL